MKKSTASIIVAVTLSLAGGTTYAEMEHSMGSHESMSGEIKHKQGMKMPEGMSMKALDIDGYRVNFHIMDHAATHRYMDNMGHKDHKMKEGMTHYIMMDITDKAGKKIKKAKVKVKIIDPDKKSQEKMLMSMMGHFGTEFDMKQKGKYQIMTLFKVGGKKHKGGFLYEKK